MFEEFAAAAQETAREAGALLIKYEREQAYRVENKGTEYDFVTDADRDSQALIRSMLQKRFPEIGFIGEEDGLSDAEIAEMLQKGGADGKFWICDPLDGTLNYIRHLGGYAVSVALVAGGKSVCGAIYTPVEDEMYTAILGKGAYLNGHKIFASDCRSLSKALTDSAVPVSDMRLRARFPKWQNAVIPATLNERMLGSSARAQALTAAGRLDAYWEIGPHPWDVAAGTLIAREAGARVSTVDGKPYALGNPSVCVCAPGIWQELTSVVSASDAAFSAE